MPTPVAAMTAEERARRVELSSDMCVVDESSFFLLGCLDLPIRDTDEAFRFLVWVSQSEQSFANAFALWETPGREATPPTFGWLSTEVPLYPRTVGLQTQVHTQPVGVRPSVVLEPSEHPLAIDQRDGISRERAIEMATALLHG